MTIEICVGSAAAAIEAARAGADRVELCENLWEGGTTPSAGTIAAACQRAGVPVFVLVRPRGGDFLYNDTEFDVMRHDVQTAKQLGASGIVTGILTADGRVDTARTAELVALAHPLPVTFHRAFDMAADPFAALEDCVRLGIRRILTSGQARTAIEGAELIAELVRRANGRTGILPGAGINEKNAARLVAQTGVTELHFTAHKTVDSGMGFRQTDVYMGGVVRPPEFSLTVTDADKIRRVMETLATKN